MNGRTHIDCYGCKRPVETTAWDCPSCGRLVAEEIESRVSARRFLRTWSVGIFTVTAISAVALTGFGALAAAADTAVPAWILGLCAGGILWLVADKLETPYTGG